MSHPYTAVILSQTLLWSVFFTGLAPVSAQTPTPTPSPGKNQEAQSFMRSYYHPTGTLDTREQAQLQVIQGLRHEQNYPEAKRKLESLLNAHPTDLSLHLLMGHLNLDSGEFALAQKSFKQVEIDAGKDMNWLVQARIGLADVAMMERKYKEAQSILTSFKPEQITTLPAQTQEEYYVSLAQTYRATGDYFQAHTNLEMAINHGNGSTDARDEIAKHKKIFAQANYMQAMKLYQEDRYLQAITALNQALSLVPDNPVYVAALSQVHTTFIQKLKIKTDKMRPILIPILKDIRFHLDMENFEQAYKNYMKLRANEEVGFFLKNGYTYYLPKNMGDRLELIESVLKLHGYNIPPATS